MHNTSLSALLGHTDIYLIDQIMKDRYAPGAVVLDAGAGGGRNLHCLVQAGVEMYGVDRDPSAVAQLWETYPQVPADRFQVAPVEKLPFPDAFFDHVICSAVLHFADGHTHFKQMFGDMIRVLKPGGTLFVRMTTDVGLGDKPIPLGEGRFHLPDGSDRYLLTRPMLDTLVAAHRLQWLEPFKTVLVEEVRSMSVLMLEKGG